MTANSTVFDADHSSKTKYYGAVFIILFAIPIGAILYLSLEGSLFLTIFMFSILLSLLLLMAYFTFSSGSLKYELSIKQLNVKFGLLNKKVTYSRIVNVEKAQLSLSLRLFGASLPGFHWGLYRTNLGNAHVYGTKISGDYIIVTLISGQKIALSPKEADRFLDTLKEMKAQFGTIQPRELEKEKQSLNKFLYAQVLAVTAAYCVFLGYFFWVYVSLPQVVPVHFGFDGVANRWGDKSELLWLAGIAVMFPVINGVLALKFGRHERGMLVLLGTIFVVAIAVFVYALSTIAVAV